MDASGFRGGRCCGALQRAYGGGNRAGSRHWDHRSLQHGECMGCRRAGWYGPCDDGRQSKWERRHGHRSREFRLLTSPRAAGELRRRRASGAALYAARRRPLRRIAGDDGRSDPHRPAPLLRLRDLCIVTPCLDRIHTTETVRVKPGSAPREPSHFRRRTLRKGSPQR